MMVYGAFIGTGGHSYDQTNQIKQNSHSQHVFT